MSRTFDAIVLGVGGMGSAACFELARRGRRVLGLEQFPLVHDRGSSHGHTRIIRTAYYEHPNYVPLLRRAFARWYELEQLTGRHLLTECPALNIGPTDGELVSGVRASVREHGLAAAELTAPEIARRYPFRFPDDYAGILEANAGFLYVEECVRAHVDAAVSLGAEVRADEAVRGWKAVGEGVRVTTDRGTYRAAKLVITAGAWATTLLADLGVPLTVMRQVLLWFDVARSAALARRDTFPIFIADVPGGPFYGLPAIDRFGLKIARHYGAPELTGPDGVKWETTPADEPPVRAFLDAHLPALTGGMTKGQVCMYTLTPDRHFVIDVHPGFPQVSVACGFSGHGFKFASVVGEVLADLADRGRTDHPIGMFRATRFSSE
ncbi:MAG: soxA [Gemmataceae bacterium]|nr:soxA [Gemmataceae bacterium]